MAYSTISTFTAASVPTEAQLNQMRDNLLSLRRFNDYGVHLSLDDDMTIANSTVTPIVWTKTEHQTGNLWTSGLPTRITAQVAGRYLIVAMVEWRNTAGGIRWMGVKKNGGVTMDFSIQDANSGSGSQSGMDVIELAATNYLEVIVSHSQGSPLEVRGNGADRTNVFCYLVGAS